ncbi:MAG: sulfatase [Bacteroidota bacterium]
MNTLSTLLTTSCFVFLSFCVLSCQKQNPPPNVLFILADDLGYHDLSITGSDYYETPHIDRIAREGMQFTQGYAACQVCSPSRASIMLGQFTARHGITDWIGARADTAWREKGRYNQLLPADYNRAMPKAATTLAEAMQMNGYTTFFAGKWHLGEEDNAPEDHGFDINIGGYSSGSPKGGFYSPWQNPKLTDKKAGENLSMRLAHETVDFLKTHQDSSFFAFLSFYAVHGPIQTTQKKWSKYRDKAEAQGIADSGYEMGHFLPIRQTQDNPVYAGLVETMDDAVGVVLKALDALGLAENTIVIFTSDNGGVAAGDDFSTTNLPLRGGKGYQYEGGIREPFFIKAPGVKAGQTCATPVIATDFYPTILEMIGAAIPEATQLDAISLVPLLKENKTVADRPFIWHYPHYGNQGGQPSSILRLGDWKLIYYYEDESVELFDLVNDPSEQNDLSAQEMTRATQMRDQLFVQLESMNARYPKRDPLYDPALEARYLDTIINEKLPSLEARRLQFLSKDFDPGNKWWGSAVED